MTNHYDLLVVGGGVNGTGIARDAAGRGLSVLLCEQHDLAAHTSSASTKLIHGGLRYLEQYEFSLVRKALQEREVLLRSAPHIIWPLRFILPHDSHHRPAWMIRIGLFFYDHLARRRRLPASHGIRFAQHPAGAPLRPQFVRGFEYSDGWVDDSRLVALNAVDAAERGARVLTRTRCVTLTRDATTWSGILQGEGSEAMRVTARAVVNATGPWVSDFLHTVAPLQADHSIRLVKGSHIVTRQLFAHPYAYIFQNADKRIIFAIPYEQDFTLIGTTDVDQAADPAHSKIDAAEIDYLCDNASLYFRRAITPSDVVWSYSGVRPLLDDESGTAASVTRDYSLELDEDGAPLLSVFGGKITTFRKLAEQAVDKLAEPLRCRALAWTKRARLPGGDMRRGNFESFLRKAAARFRWLPPALLHRYARAYGTRLDRLLQGAAAMSDLGEAVLDGLYAREIEYLRRTEWARSADDILWRRSKLGLHLPAGSAAILDAWLNRNPVPGAA